MKMKMINPGARHIVCAYWISAPGVPPHYQADFHDDQEPGAGRILLNWMKENNLQNRVFFIARYYANKMDSERFKCYVDAANRALNENPINFLTKQDQSPPGKEPPKSPPRMRTPQQQRMLQKSSTTSYSRIAQQTPSYRGNQTQRGGHRQNPRSANPDSENRQHLLNKTRAAFGRRPYQTQGTRGQKRKQSTQSRSYGSSYQPHRSLQQNKRRPKDLYESDYESNAENWSENNEGEWTDTGNEQDQDIDHNNVD